ncbi:MAG: lipopolysaccharide assembly protein LapA domain-containing protein [Acidimicrobiales bacterium]
MTPVRRPRIGGAWAAGAAAVVIGVALIDFIVQNTRSVRIEFFGASGQIPVSVAVLGAALVGVFVALAAGAAKATLLRLKGRRSRRLGMTEKAEPNRPYQ